MNSFTSRRLLQQDNVYQVAYPSPSSRDATPHLTNGSSAAAAFRRPFDPNTHLDSSVALTIIVLLTAFFFMGLFSVYIRRSNHDAGLQPAAVNSLPLVAYAKHQMMEDCPICLTEFQERETVKLIPYCGHVFHRKCVETWLVSHVTCPVCRSDRVFNAVVEG